MNQQSQKMSSTNHNSSRKRRRRPKGEFSAPAMSFLSAKKSSIPSSEESENLQKNIVEWGKGNLYPYYLNYLAKKNSMHSGILRSKRFFTVSGGLVYSGADTQAWDEFYKCGKSNHTDKNQNELMWDVSLNFEKSNLFCYKVIMTKVGERKFRKMVEIPFYKLRYEVKQDKEGKTLLTGRIKVSNDWSNDRLAVKTLEPYQPNNEEQREFFVLYQEESGQSLDSPTAKKINPGIYPDPPYGGSIVSIDTGIEISQYNNSEIHNGFSLGTVLNLNNGKPKNEEAKKKQEKELGAAATGSQQAGRTIILYNNGKDREASVLSLNGNNLPDRYLNTKKAAEESIAHGHSVTSTSLFGIKTEGSFNADESEAAYMIMQSNYFKARREALLSVLNWIAKDIVGLQGEITFEDVPLVLPDSREVPAVTVNVSDNKPEKVKQKKFNKEETDKILESFKAVGRDKKDFQVLFSETYTDYANESTEALIDSFKKDRFQNLSDNMMQTLNLISEGEEFNSIREALNISGTELAGIYRRLVELEMISDTGELLELGAAEIVASDLSKMEVLYEYRKRADAPELLPGGESREFCEALITQDRLYTREEINTIGLIEGYDVFAYRGGWYHDWRTDQNQPGCRHEWAQVITFVN